MAEGSSLAAKIENSSSDQHEEIFALKRLFFHKFESEKDLHKYCLKSKEIKLFLAIVFSVFNYCEEAMSDGASAVGERPRMT